MPDMENKIEVLAPAGNEDALRAAVFAGCDAVYLGGSLFSARASAVNFSDEELTEAVDFCHRRGVKVYVTVNTLLKDSELQEAIEFVKFLCSISVDGILVQDMGLYRIISEICPEMHLHASTQMSIFSPEAVRMLENSGADRVVLARELSINEIKEIHDYSPVELEAFVHGAMCMSVSGQCYFSAMLGSRSGNRGRCAQPCRLPFTSPDGKTNVLSLKDLSFIKNIQELQNAGVVSAKIEGRMKRPEYVAAAVACARKAADGEEIPQELIDNLEAVFSRSGFSSAYLDGKTGPSMFGIRTKEDVTAGSGDVFSRLHELYKGEANRVQVCVKSRVVQGEPVKITISDHDGHSITMQSESIVEKALNRPLTAERIEEQLRKLGSTPFYAESAECVTDGESIIPMSQLNALRREAAEKLSDKRAERTAVPCSDYAITKDSHNAAKISLQGVFSSLDHIPDNANKLDVIYLPLTESIDNFRKAREIFADSDVRVNMPRAYFGAEKEVEEKAFQLQSEGFNDFLCPNLNSLALAEKLGANIHGGFSLNVFNSESVKTFEQMGLRSLELSFELELKEAQMLGGSIPRGVIAYGRLPLMLVRACPIGHGRCVGCRKTECITDRKGISFPVMCMKGKNYRSIEVLNSLPLNMSDRLNEIKNMDFLTLRFTDENKAEAGKIIDCFAKGIRPEGSFTRGLYYRGVI